MQWAVNSSALLLHYPRRESNTNLQFRKPSFYPLNYGDFGGWKRRGNNWAGSGTQASCGGCGWTSAHGVNASRATAAPSDEAGDREGDGVSGSEQLHAEENRGEWRLGRPCENSDQPERGEEIHRCI